MMRRGQAAKQLSHSKQLPHEKQRFASWSACGSSNRRRPPRNRGSLVDGEFRADCMAVRSLKMGRFNMPKSTIGCFGGDSYTVARSHASMWRAAFFP